MENQKYLFYFRRNKGGPSALTVTTGAGNASNGSEAANGSAAVERGAVALVAVLAVVSFLAGLAADRFR